MSEWIDNKFPEHMQHVIVACCTPFGCDVFDDHYYNAKTCQYVKYGEYHHTAGVTHWQPLPDPPK